jgi:ABC transporter substrate binding protein
LTASGGAAAAWAASGTLPTPASAQTRPGQPTYHYLPATADTVHWGYFSKLLKLQLEVDSGDYVTIEALTHHANDDPKRLRASSRDGGRIMSRPPSPISMLLSRHTKRRAFIAALGGAAAWPFVARGQQTERVRRVGVLMALGADDPESKARVTAFVQGLAQLGWIIGQNVQVDYRWALNFDDVHRYVAELVALAPDVILTHSSATVAPLLQATRTVPIVFTLVADPVGAGYVDSLAHPGGNATGFTIHEYAIGAKWLELLKQIAPTVTRVAVIRDPAIAAGTGQFGAIQSVASTP